MLRYKNVIEEKVEIPVNRLESINLDVSFQLDTNFITVIMSKPPSLVWDRQSSVASLLETEEAKISVSVESYNPGKVIHEIVSLCLSREQTDVPIRRTVQAPYHPDKLRFLDMTPDFLIMNEQGNPKFFCELGTNRSRFLESARIDFDSKNSDLITKLSGAGSFVDSSTIIVYAGGIISNLDFNDQEAEILVSVFMFAQRVHSQLCETYYLHETNEDHDLQFWRDQFALSMSKHNLPEQSVAPVISQQMVNYWNEERQNLSVVNVVKSISILTFNKLKKECVEWGRMSARQYAEREIEAFKERLEIFEIKDDQKSPFQLPFFEVCEFTGRRPIIISDEPTCKIWNEAFDQGFPEQPSEDEFKIVREGKEWNKTSNRAFGKRLIQVTRSDQVDLSLTGLFGKQFKNKDANDKKHKEQKKSYDLSAKTLDIEGFISDTDFWFNKGSYWDPVYTELEDLIDFSRVFNDDINRPAKEFIKDFSKTRVGKYARMLSMIAQELNLSIAKKVKKDEFVFRKIKDLDVYLLCKPTGTHLFFSICYRGEPSKKPFKVPIYQNDGYCYTDFVSTDRNRITSILNCYENLALLYNHVIKMDIEQYGEITPKSRKKVLFCFGMMLENKQVTADIIYLMRYAYMKVTSGNHFSNPLRLLNKVNQMRSRFAVYIVQHFITSFLMMADKMPTRVEPELQENNEDTLKVSSDCFDNLIDFISYQEEQSLEYVINTSYFGTYHSYATMDQSSAERKVLSKLIVLEMDMRRVRDEHMWKESQFGSHLTHEFNLSVSLAGSRLRRQNLERIFGDQTDNMIFREFKRVLSRSYLDFCTYKASMVKSDNEKFDGNGPKSKKAVINVIPIFDMNVNSIYSPYSDMDFFFHHFFTCIQAKVNQKMDQPTGLREILTMDMISRMGLKILESLMEWINSFSESETLSKGNRKEQILKSFNQEIAAKIKEGFIVLTIKCSIDHAKWCQMFVMTKFASGLSDLLPKDIFKFACLLLNLITNKRIYISKDVLMTFLKNPDMKGFDEQINELKEQFLGRSDFSDLIEENGAYLKNRSNMGQGWLQNTSGGDGDADVMLVKLTASFMIKNAIRLGQLGEDTQLISNAVDSSDDQSYQFALIVKEENKKKAVEFLTLISMIPEVVSSESNKRMGPEKTEEKHRQDVVEFNQLFQSGNTQFVGLTKFNKASMELPVTLNMTDRFSNLSNTRRNILENGGDHSHVDLCQELQSIMHYRSLGCGMDPLFSKFKDKLLLKPHQNFGLFLFEEKEICGLLGNDFARYKASKREDYNRMTRKFLKNADVVMGIDGQKGPMVKFRVVNTESFKDFSKGFKLRDGFFEVNPHVLYLGAETREEMRELLVNKVLDPSSELSFTHESTAKVMQASHMFLRQPILKYSPGLDRFGKREYKSVNIFAFMDEMDPGEMCSEEDIHVLYPRWELYERISESVQKSENFYAARSHKISRNKAVYNFDMLYSTPKITLLDCVKEIWFGHRTKHNRTLITESFNTYKATFSWLKDTHNLTYGSSRNLFESVEQMYSSIVSMSDQISNPKVLCSLKASGVLKMIENTTKYNWQRGYILFPKEGRILEREPRDSGMLTRICLTLSGPFHIAEKYELLSNVSYMPLSKFTMERNRTIRNLSLASQILRGDLREVYEKISFSKDSIVGIFIKKQYKNFRGEWHGDCVYMLMIEQSVFRIELIRDVLTIYCRSKVEVNMQKGILLRELARLGWDQFMVSDGLRVSRTGLHNVRGELGFSYNFKPNAIYEMDLSGRNMYVDITSEGKVLIQQKGERENSTILSFHFDLRDLAYVDKALVDEEGVQRQWIEDTPFGYDELMNIKEFEDEEIIKWLKFMFCKKMDYRTGKILGADVFAKKESHEEFLFDEAEFPELNLQFDEEFMEEVQEALGDEQELPDMQEFIFDEYADLNMMYHANLKESIMTKHIIERTHCFDLIIKELQFLNIDQLYLSEFRMNLSTGNPWFPIFIWLTDYDKRPLAYSQQFERKDFFSSDGIYGFGESNVQFLREYGERLELLGYRVIIPDHSLVKMAKGIYLFHKGKKEVVNLKGWRKEDKYEELRTFLISRG